MRSLTSINVCIWVGVRQQQETRWIWGCWPFSDAMCCLCATQMKGCIKVLKEQPSNSVEGLLNALRCVWTCVTVEEILRDTMHTNYRFWHISPLLVAFLFRYTTRHLNDDSTSKQIRALLQWERGERWREREERRSALEGGEKRRGNKCQWLINLFVYNEQRKSSPG